ncbi:MAG TPA: 4-(cytidine 5'-diphospho)-2-C-methyl-D-erythritol kinase [Bacillales bacterium]|nr:4-(cytidine 5'-diphospho)-2-C-methyl-D-erythritol kinase [Bacillales bacterium]
MRIYVKAPAKINLALDVLRKREDGYHEVNMVMTTIDLADRLELQEISGDVIRLSTTSSYLPEDDRNLAFRAAKLVKERFSVKKGVSIFIDKQIPVAAGLAGGSSDAAGVLKGLNQLWELGLSREELASLGSKIGSDVAFCVYGGTALATGRGEILKPISSPPPCWVVLAKPEIGVSTKETYAQLDLKRAHHPDVSEVVMAIENADYHSLCKGLGNIFEEQTMKKVPQVAQIKEKMQEAGADGVLMSGSGPTVFGLTRMETRAKRMVNALHGFCPNVYKVHMIGTSELE